MTSPEIYAASEPVIEELGQQIMLLDQEGCSYAQGYFAHILHGSPRPKTPLGMHHQIAKAIRDMVLDETVALRMRGARRRAA